MNIYGPSITDGIPLDEHRTTVFSSDDQHLFLHVGHFIAWYAAAEMMLTMLVHTFSGGIDASQFHALTKGMDGKIKVERLKTLVTLCKWEMSDPFRKRLEHFQNVLIPMRNSLMHSHLYWGRDDHLQMTSIAAPPMVDGGIAGEIPKKISGLELYERGRWLHLFAQDLGGVFNDIHDPLKTPGTLGTIPFQSPLPTGNHPKTGPKSSPAKKHTLAQKQKRTPQ